jgi:hypothetical protein
VDENQRVVRTEFIVGFSPLNDDVLSFGRTPEPILVGTALNKILPQL